MVLRTQIDHFARLARERQIPLVTTECWAIVFYNECGLDWGWMKELCCPRRARGRKERMLGRYRHEQLLRAAVPRHVGGRLPAPAR